MIVDLSYPEGLSVNDGIRREWCLLQYASVDNAVEIIQLLGPGAVLAKLDLKDAYRIILVHPDDHYLLGTAWLGEVYVDRSLPFGLRSASLLFTAFSDMVAWAIHCQGVRFIMHYLDNFLVLGPPALRKLPTLWTLYCSFYLGPGSQWLPIRLRALLLLYHFWVSSLIQSGYNFGCRRRNWNVSRHYSPPGRVVNHVLAMS
jgi:hypothetical protein